MTQVLITGATGLVGGHLLRMLLNEPRIHSIAAPTRRPLADMVGVYNPHDPQLTDALAQVIDPVDIVFAVWERLAVRPEAKRRLFMRIIRWWWIPR